MESDGQTMKDMSYYIVIFITMLNVLQYILQPHLNNPVAIHRLLMLVFYVNTKEVAQRFCRLHQKQKKCYYLQSLVTHCYPVPLLVTHCYPVPLLVTHCYPVPLLVTHCYPVPLLVTHCYHVPLLVTHCYPVPLLVTHCYPVPLHSLLHSLLICTVAYYPLLSSTVDFYPF